MTLALELSRIDVILQGRMQVPWNPRKGAVDLLAFDNALDLCDGSAASIPDCLRVITAEYPVQRHLPRPRPPAAHRS